MKFLLSIPAIAALLLIASCNEPGPIENTPANQSAVSSISGVLRNWEEGTDKSIVFSDASGFWTPEDRPFSRSPIAGSGAFVLKDLANPPASKLLNPVYFRFAEGAVITNNSVVCSDSSAKVGFSSFNIITNGDSTEKVRGSVYRRNFNNEYYYYDDSVKAGDFHTDFYYADKDVKVKGSVNVDYFDMNFKRQYITKYNFNFAYKKGWNPLVTYIVSNKVTQKSDRTIIESEQYISNFEPQGGRWDYNYYDWL